MRIWIDLPRYDHANKARHHKDSSVRLQYHNHCRFFVRSEDPPWPEDGILVYLPKQPE